jgi:hypothetical protein
VDTVIGGTSMEEFVDTTTADEQLALF